MSTVTLSTSLVKKLTALLTELSAAVEAPAAAAPAPVAAPAKGRGRPAKKAAAAPAAKESTRAPRGSVKEAVLEELKAAGKAGMSVTDLAEKLETKAQNLYTWFNQTGKKIPQIKKAGRGTYRYVGR